MSDEFEESILTANEGVTDEIKTRAIVAHITLIGWIIALIQNNNNKSEFVSFYIRQMLGLIILMFIGSILTVIFIGFLIHIVGIILWVMSIVAVTKKEKELTPIIGKYFQDWFKSL